MPYPAYQGAIFYFDIVIGAAWTHEFRVNDRNTGEPMEFEAGWQGLMVIRDHNGIQLAKLSETGSDDGLITFTTGLITLQLPSAFSATLPATTTYGQQTAKAFHSADLTLTDPDNAEPYIAARGKGVTYLPTVIGA